MAIRDSKTPPPLKRTPTSRFINASLNLWQTSPIEDQKAIKQGNELLKQVVLDQLAGHEVYTHYLEMVDVQTQTSYFYDLTAQQRLKQRLPDLMVRFDQPYLFES